MIQKFAHSGTYGDLIYGLPIMMHSGGGEFYLRLYNVDNISHTYYQGPPPSVHRGRMTPEDLEFMRSFLEHQTYVTKVGACDNIEITHDLDAFRPLFRYWCGNYVDCYSAAFGIDWDQWEHIRNTPWLTVPSSLTRDDGRNIAVNRTERYVFDNENWKKLRDLGYEDRSFFLGNEIEHQIFETKTGWKIPRQRVSTMMELAQYISGSDTFIGNFSMPLSIAFGLGHKILAEYRRDRVVHENECVFIGRDNVKYF